MKTFLLFPVLLAGPEPETVLAASFDIAACNIIS